MMFCSLLTLIPLEWPSLSPSEHSLHLPAAASVAELRMQALSPLLFPSLLLPGLPGATASSRAGWGWGWRWMWDEGGFQSLWFGWVLGRCPSHCVCFSGCFAGKAQLQLCRENPVMLQTPHCLTVSQLSWVVFSSQAIGVQKGKGKAIDLASETSCKQL